MLIRLCPSRSYSQASTSGFNIPTVVSHYESKNRAKKRADSSRTFRMVLPPPNVTGDLHIGHALTATIEDAMCRYRRFQGDEVLWYPGFDHAGIATQTVVERRLWKESKLRRDQLSPEEFLTYCQKWKDARIDTITKQLKKMGTLLDWGSSYYTMDPKFSKAVASAFCRLYTEGLIFRDERLVNWCPTLKSSISDQEVEKRLIKGNEMLTLPSRSEKQTKKVELGVLHVIRFELMDRRPNDPIYLEVATTRPETMFSDVALVVNPNDERYTAFVGRRVLHPLVKRPIPIIADEDVIIDFGTGILKITPAHNFTDFAIAQRHLDKLDRDFVYLSCIGQDGQIIGQPTYEGFDRFDAREKIVERLQKEGLYRERIVKNGHSQIPLCSRSGDIVEPMLMEQWFLKCDELHSDALKALEKGEFSLNAPGYNQSLIDWFTYPDPWCLSRQLLWGHRIPAYLTPEKRWLIASSEAEARSSMNINTEVVLRQDPDVLDTWFSSALIPLIVRGWPDKPIVEAPLDLMETGHDILGFWVARMLILCRRLSGMYPFKKIILHGLVRDSMGRKMSKSLGNVIDPLDIIDGFTQEEMIDRLKKSALGPDELAIAEKDIREQYPNGIEACGADALRFALLQHDLFSQDINVDVSAMSNEGKRFCNKLWNMTAYANSVFDKVPPNMSFSHPSHSMDIWIESNFARSVKRFQSNMDEHNEHLAFRCLKHFIVNELCDIYVETTKRAVWDDDMVRIQQISNTLFKTLKSFFAAFSMFMPQISEYLYDRMPLGNIRNIDEYPIEMLSSFQVDDKIEEAMNFAKDMMDNVKEFRNMLGIKPNVPLQGIVKTHVDLPLSIKELVTLIGDLKKLNITDFDVNGDIDTTFIACHLMQFDAVVYVRFEPPDPAQLVETLAKEEAKWSKRLKTAETTLQKYKDAYEKHMSSDQPNLSLVEKTRGAIDDKKNDAMEARAKLERIGKLRKIFNIDS